MSRAVAALVVLAQVLLGRGALAAPPRTIAIVETRPVGVAPESATAVTRQLYATVARLGHRAVPDTATAEHAGAFANGTSSPAALLQVARETHAESALFAQLSAENGRYVLVVSLANTDLTGPFSATDGADAKTLESTADRLVRSLIPAAPPPESSTEEAPAPRSEELGPRLALQTEGAFGLGRRFFYNHLAGARVDYGFPGDFAIGGYLGYANLKGKDGRASNVLPYAQVEYRLHVAESSGILIPFRLGSGYLPRNGPFLRLAAGVSFPLGGTARLGLDLLAPTVWVVRNSTAFSMDVAAEVSFGF
ncbi:MAG TPA: hypothetical protein VHE30_03330 [Polyangiaceae bacterium]|nr:hypothetical protein [Polyangiaceae bacterium]